MKIGFDLDGVVATQDIAMLQVIRYLEDHDPKTVDWIREWYYRSCKLLLDPKLVMTDTDEGYIITCRQDHLIPLTELWCRTRVPYLKLIILPAKKRTDPQTYKEWLEDLSQQKAAMINRLRLDLYFEDILQVMQRLRKLCPNCKIIKYGTDIHEELI